MRSLSEEFYREPYASYAYAYPHKTAYRPLTDGLPLREVWERERREALFLYIHVPFCEMRCGFCNLFTTANPAGSFTHEYLMAMRREAVRVRDALGDAAFARMAIGGGTPTYLNAGELEALFDMTAEIIGVQGSGLPLSVETSPQTATRERLMVLRERGTTRISMGVQSFSEDETAAAGRAQKTAEVRAAIERIRDVDFPVLNLDLIYGIAGQSVESWLDSLRAALEYRPEELYLYPLYVRPLTGLDRRYSSGDDLRLACYRAGRGMLREAGYEQVSMRMFRRSRARGGMAESVGPVYCCQEDGMVGLGCGARSYTRTVHYSTEYAVGARGVREILAHYVSCGEADFDVARFGFVLKMDEQRRRYVVKSLLQAEGLSKTSYREQFGEAPLDHFPCLERLIEEGFAEGGNGALRLTESGMEVSDAIGPWLYSPAVKRAMKEYELR